MPVQVPDAVLRAFSEVRELGIVNMLDRNRVAEVLRELGHEEARNWLRSNPEQYAHGVFIGFEAKQGECS